MKILLMGNPNVGKSVIFSRLTGVKVISANYPGTTVGFTRGYMKVGTETAEIIDVPGTYTLEPTSEAEQVALRMLETGDMVINVVNATNLERNLYLTLQLLERDIPMVVALNLWDDARHQGIQVDLEKLRVILGVAVIPTVAVTGEGIKEMVAAVLAAKPKPAPPQTGDERWIAIGKIIEQVQQISHRHHTLLDRLEDASVRPFSGLLIALVVLVITLLLVRTIGEGVIDYILDPFFNHLWTPLLLFLSRLMGGSGFFHNIIVGQVSGNEIDYLGAFGLLSSGLYVSLAMVLPYIFAFYLALGLLEDIGYLPRLGVLMDNIMHRLGLHGYAIIPTLLGMGCNVPAILATRILESKRERFIAATLISIAVPCASLQAMVAGLVGHRGIQYVVMVYGTLFLVWLVLGVILSFLVKGFKPELLIEIPKYRIPPWQAVLQKLGMRVRGFLVEAIPVVMGAVLVVNILYYFGIFDKIADFTAPLVTGVWGLPKEAVTAVVIGFLRKDVAMGMLAPLGLSTGQLVTGAVVLAMFFPCIATFTVLTRELGAVNMLKAAGVMVVSSLAVGGILNLVL